MENFGKYQVTDLIGEGGFGKVYRGWDPVLKRYVAIKTCSFQEEHLRRRFVQEAEVAAGLQHPNIVTVHDFGTEGDRPYLVQEYLEGEDLDVLIREGEAGDPETRVGYLREIAAGLAFAHERDVVHRDVKPSNIRVLPDGRVRIMDFGIAKVLTAEENLTRTGMSLGTAGYVSPEQLEGKEVDGRADIFSFGVLAYELVSGSKPFQGKSVSELFYQISHEDPPPVEEVAPDCDPALAACIDRCLRKDRERRYADFGAVREALDAVGGDDDREAAAGAAAGAVGLAAGGASGGAGEPEAGGGGDGPARASGGVMSRGAWAALVVVTAVVAAFGVVQLVESRGLPLVGGGEGADDAPAVAGGDTATADAAAEAVADPAADPAVASSGAAAGGEPAPGAADPTGADPVEEREDPTPVGEASRTDGPAAEEEAGMPSASASSEEAEAPVSGVLVVVRGAEVPGHSTVENVLLRELRDDGYDVADRTGLELRSAAAGDEGSEPGALGRRAGVAVVVLADYRADAARSVGGFFTGTATLSVRTYDTRTGQTLGSETFRVGGGGEPGELGNTAADAATSAAETVGYRAAGALNRLLRDHLRGG